MKMNVWFDKSTEKYRIFHKSKIHNFDNYTDAKAYIDGWLCLLTREENNEVQH